MFTKRVGFEVPEGITLIESRLSGFIPEEKALRDELIAETKTCDTPFVVFDLPYHEYVKSFGRGFTVMVLETLQEMGYVVTVLPVECKYWGSPIDHKRVFVIGAPKVLEGGKELVVTNVADWDPTAIFHSVTGLPLAKVQPGLVPMREEFVPSRSNTFGELKEYVNAPALVARKSGNTYALHAITSMVWSNIYGVELNTDLTSFSKITPSTVLMQLFDFIRSEGAV
jgi:hypothetical protein